MSVQRATVHPFPARMAPELVADRIQALQEGHVVLDPMMGSGTFVLSAAMSGLKAVGVDSDPLALMIARASVEQVDADIVIQRAENIVERVRGAIPQESSYDAETQAFIDFWFDRETQCSLRGIAQEIKSSASDEQSVLWCALSRLIITKDAGVSRARDVSHSRPHLVREKASFDPLDRFVESVKVVLRRRLDFSALQRDSLTLLRGDARTLPFASETFDAIMTSPPYLNAIDYLRGHRLSLVWMGYTIADLRALRGNNIGSERGMELDTGLEIVRDKVVDGPLTRSRHRILNRYLHDLDALTSEMARILKPEGSVTLVVANSNHSGTQIAVDEAMSLLGARHGFREQSRFRRPLPANRRYLPPPGNGVSALVNRMRTETILTMRKN